jgi:hypothetical protein
MRPGRRKLARTASSATNLPAVVVVAEAVIKTPAVAVVVTFVAIDSLVT